MDGVDLSPLLSDSATDWPDRTLFVQTHRGSPPRRYHCCAAIGQNYKWLGYPGEGDVWTFDASEDNPVMELYDLESDPGEQENLAGSSTELVAQMRKDYAAWFDDVTTDWRAETIHIGNAAENSITLCRYQDSEYRDGLPFGWRVRIEHGGTCEIGIKHGPFYGAGALNINWGGTEVSASLEAGENTDRLSLAEGEGSLDIWFELDGVGRLTFSSTEPIGDVRMEWLGP